MNFTANSKVELQNHIGSLAIKVSPRAQGRTTPQREQYYIHRLLHLLLEYGRLDTPFELEKRERPDFRIRIGDTVVGIETTEAVNPANAQADSLRNKLDAERILAPIRWRESRSKEQIDETLRHPKLTGTVWSGDTVEEFVQPIVYCIEVKHPKLLANYCRFDEDCLLVYHNHPTPDLDFAEAIERTDQRLTKYWNTGGFNAVFVLKYERPARLTIYSKAHPPEFMVEGESMVRRGNGRFMFGTRRENQP